MSARFRPLTADAVAALLALMERFYVTEHLTFDPEVARCAVEGLLADPAAGGIWFIESDSELVGYVVFTTGYSLEFHGRDGLVDELYIEPTHRSSGLGSAALAFLEGECRARGIRALHLQVGHDNPRALALYRRSGFEAHARDFLTKWL